MAEQNIDLTLGLLSKSSPSQLQAFQFNRSRSQPPLTEGFYASSPKMVVNNNNNLKPSNLSHVPCKFYKQGTCTAGANCTFSHSSDLSSESAVCKYFVKGNCKFGTKCALLHTMSPYGVNGASSVASSSNGMKPPSLSFTGRRKTTEQMMNYSTSTNSLDHRSFLNDPFASSAPAVSLFHGEQLWRNQQTPRINMIGVRSSPRESSDQLLGSSPLFNYRQQSSSLRSSNSGYFNHHQYITGSNQMEDFTPQQQNGYDLNDAMLPSSLNDLFTPNELHARSLRQSRDIVQQQSSFETQNQPWRVPSFKEGTAAINIPSTNTSGGSSGTGSSGSYLQGQQNDDDEFQFYMEDDEAVTFDHLNNKSTPSYTMPPLISLPST